MNLFTKKDPPCCKMLQEGIEHFQLRMKNEDPEHIEYPLAIYALEQELERVKAKNACDCSANSADRYHL